jgi:hypothetical protein
MKVTQSTKPQKRPQFNKIHPTEKELALPGPVITVARPFEALCGAIR